MVKIILLVRRSSSTLSGDASSILKVSSPSTSTVSTTSLAVSLSRQTGVPVNLTVSVSVSHQVEELLIRRC